MAHAEAERGEAAKAAILFGASEGLREKLGIRFPLHEKESDERGVGNIRAKLDDAAWRKAFLEGKKLTWQRATAYALNEVETP
jgi:hypothetical protein